jgi:hypothetical protein
MQYQQEAFQIVAAIPLLFLIFALKKMLENMLFK